MSQVDIPVASVVDVVFPLEGHSLPREHTQALAQALGAQLPWLATEPLAGIHRVKMVAGNDSHALLSQRTRLLMRLPRARVAALSALPGQTLDVGGSEVRLGAPHLRELLPHATLYAYAVAAASDDELIFMETVASELQSLQVRAHTVCGKRQHLVVAGRTLDTFSLMLHGLSPQHSLLLQEQGVGGHRLLGCGTHRGRGDPHPPGGDCAEGPEVRPADRRSVRLDAR